MQRIASFMSQTVPKVIGGLGKVGQAAVGMGGTFNKAIRGMTGSIDTFLSKGMNIISFQRVNKAINMINQSVMQFGASLRRSGFDLLFAGGSITLGFGSTLKDLTDLDKILSSIKGTTPLTSSEFGKLSKTIRSVGETSQFTATEVAEVALQLTKAGVALGKMNTSDLDNLLRSMVGFGLSSGIEDLGQLTEIAVQATGTLSDRDWETSCPNH